MAATTEGRRAKTAHVNMMTDTIINNVPAEGLRAIMRSLLASHPEITATFEDETRRYIQDVALPRDRSSSSSSDVSTLKKTQKTIRCMLGCGLSSQSISLMANLAVQGVGLLLEHPGDLDDGFLASIDGDIVQLVTAMEKKLLAAGRRELDGEDEKYMGGLRQQLMGCHERTQEKDLDYPYGRALTAASLLLGAPIPQFDDVSDSFQQEIQYVSAGMMAFDMADHYGDAEIVFGRFNSAYAQKGGTFAATKYCVFSPMKVTREAIAANVSERCRRLQTNKIDLLQFHWQFYDDPQYLDALRFLAEDERVGTLGLCNFDAKHMDNVISNGIKVHSNQVQFSLIDSRPVVRMATVCEQHDVKLLTYGTLCGGFLAEKWLGQVEPDLYAETITPSQRKYHAMIRSWGGWTLFQELLQVLKDIAAKHNVSVSTVAIRWVLDFAYVGAVIVGARMGISEHADENLASLGWSLDESDRDLIEEVLKRSKRLEMFEDVGDCGGEYR
ncbi:putative oxidoreductase [Colletotrichum spinosum]|uniref:Putative oxidoreductase n=1 Tax=Colletotrichum spinosum TaxID=1347390 RepID=A0A4R8QVS5_9PEZI|nr:putative oxidoreductase [Colletotrichum spinosum]